MAPKKKKAENRLKTFVSKHKAAVILSGVFVLCALILITARLNRDFAEFFSLRIASLFRIALGAISSLIPFALSEILVIAAAVTLIVWLVFAVRALIKRSASKRVKRFLAVPIWVILAAGSLFCLTLGPCYNRYPVSTHMDLGDEIGKDEIFFALDRLIDVVNEAAPQITVGENGSTVCPKSFGELASQVNGDYNAFAARLPFLQGIAFPAKPVLLSEPMTYTHISGIYTFFTGESVVNVNYPDYLIPYTVAHEYSHQRGIAAENECNFLAFAVCLFSDDPYVRYSGAANVFSRVADAAYRLDKERYMKSISRLDGILNSEYEAYREFFKKYENNPAEKISSAVNDAYLKANSQKGGVRTYSAFVTLVVNYLNET